MALLNTIAESEYVFDEKALQLAKNFFSIEDTSLLKVGMFGYTTSMMSHMMRDSTYHRNLLYNEFFLNKSTLNNSIYNWAKMLNYNVLLTKPARIKVVLKVAVNDLLTLATVDTLQENILRINIDRGTSFNIGGFKYLLPYDMQINLIKNNEGQYNISAFYNLLNANYEYGEENKNPILKVMIESERGINYALINFTLYQLEKNEYIYSMMSNDILESTIIEQNFEGDMATFNVLYNENTNFIKSFSKIETIFNENASNTQNQYIYYTLLNDKSIRLYFDGKPKGFRPKYNSQIKLEIFTTKGSEANFSFNGNILIQDPRFDKITYEILTLEGKSYGGDSGNSQLENKKQLINRLATRQNYITSYDILNFFRETQKDYGYKIDEFKVVKSRDDFIRRQFSVFHLLRDNNDHVVPTNSVDIELDLIDLERTNYSLKPGTLIVYDRTQGRYRLLEEDELPEVYLNDNDSYLYCVPFLINLDFNQFPKANVYMTHYHKYIPLNFSYYNTTANIELLVNDYYIKRNPINDYDHFTIGCSLPVTSNVSSKLKIRTMVYKNNKPIAYADLERIGESSTFELKVKTSDSFSPEGKYIIESTFKDIETNNIIEKFALDTSYLLKFAVFNNDNLNSIEFNNVLYSGMNDLNGYSLVCELTSEENIYFANDLSDIMYLQVSDISSSGKLILRKVPLISTMFYLNDYQNTYLMNQIYQQLEITRNMSRRLENNTTIDIKFFNSYGISRYYNIDTIDLRLKFSIILNVKPTKTLQQSIERTIIDFIENSNSLIDKRFSMSNLITLLEKTYSEIKYIKIYTINNSGIQNIEQIDYLSEDIEDYPFDYVPEYLNVRKILPKDDSDIDFSYDIDITYL